MEIPVIYCGEGNTRFAQIALDAGMQYGAQMPGTATFPPYFIDQDWKKPNRERYIEYAKRHQPHIATVLDWERDEQFDEVMEWAEEIAPYVNQVAIIPKIPKSIHRIPHRIGQAEIILAYSVPTRYGGTTVPPWEFAGRPTHLLGGAPHTQMRLANQFKLNSVDGNYHQKQAIYGRAWVNGTASPKNRYFPHLPELLGNETPKTDMPYVAFDISCRNIIRAWRDL